MTQRVIFVGVHNKPGKTPLDSSTLTGRIVDAIASLLPEFEIVKSNLHDMEYLPTYKAGMMPIQEWRKRVNYKRGDIVVLLGEQVAWGFIQYHYRSQIPIERIKICHPAKRMSTGDRERYVLEAVELIKQKAPKPEA